jgi:hypothetical protein
MKALQRLAAVLLIATAGCAAKFGGTAPAETADQAGLPTAMVEFHPSEGKVQATAIPIEPGMTVQDAIEKLSAGKYFRRSNVILVRKSDSGEPFKMPVAWDKVQRRVADVNNYALHPRDRILVKEDTSTVVDDMFAKVMGKKKKKV